MAVTTPAKSGMSIGKLQGLTINSGMSSVILKVGGTPTGGPKRKSALKVVFCGLAASGCFWALGSADSSVRLPSQKASRAV